MTNKRKTKVQATRSRKLRLCKIHGKPIRSGLWRSGHRTTGCRDCYRTTKVPPPRKRRCKQHGLPIIARRWWSGYRTKGCKRCFVVPVPEDRMCRKHDRPIQPSMWIRGRHSTGCWMCLSSRPGFAAAKARYRERLKLKRTTTRRKSHLKRPRRSGRRRAAEI